MKQSIRLENCDWQVKQQVRLVSAKAERPNHLSRGGGSASQGGQPGRGDLPARGGQLVSGGSASQDGSAS